MGCDDGRTLYGGWRSHPLRPFATLQDTSPIKGEDKPYSAASIIAGASAASSGPHLSSRSATRPS